MPYVIRGTSVYKRLPNGTIEYSETPLAIGDVPVYTEDDFVILEGSIRKFVMDSRSNNVQISERFQTYTIMDETFSDYYGSKAMEFQKYTSVKITGKGTGGGIVERVFDISRESFFDPWGLATRISRIMALGKTDSFTTADFMTVSER